MNWAGLFLLNLFFERNLFKVLWGVPALTWQALLFLSGKMRKAGGVTPKKRKGKGPIYGSFFLWVISVHRFHQFFQA